VGLGTAGGSFAAVVGVASLPPPQATSADNAAQATAIGNTLPGFGGFMGALLRLWMRRIDSRSATYPLRMTGIKHTAPVGSTQQIARCGP
jgi:hypothetical protein